MTIEAQPRELNYRETIQSEIEGKERYENGKTIAELAGRILDDYMSCKINPQMAVRTLIDVASYALDQQEDVAFSSIFQTATQIAIKERELQQSHTTQPLKES